MTIRNRTEKAAARVSGRWLAAPGGRPTRVAGVAVPAALSALSALHVAWALGWRWPGGDDEAFAERVMGNGELPPVWATWIVAALLLGSATTVVAADTDRPGRAAVRATWGLAGLFAARATLPVPVDLARGLDGPYERLDLTVYAPLCLAIAAGAALVARRGAQASRGRLATNATSST